MVRKFTLFCVFVLTVFALRSQQLGSHITISSSVPSDLTICGQAKVFSFTINNPSPFTLTNVNVNLVMPSGVVYQPGSATNAIVTNTVPNAPAFSVSNIPTLSSVVVTFTASVNCDVLAFLSLGNPIENTVTVNYTANSTAFYNTHTTNNYVIKQPNLSITNVTNQSYAGAIGATFSRCITIINGGLGELSAITLRDVHGNGVQITAVNSGAWTSAGGTETILLGAADFATIGNNNGLFESGESITICETVSIINCSSVLSSFEASWGCSGQACQTTLSNANIVFPNFIPNLRVTPQGSQVACLAPGNISTQQLKVENIGVGQAVNVNLEVFQATGPGYNSGLQSAIDLASIKISINGGAATSYTTASSQANAAFGCLPANPKGAFVLNIPTINAGDVLIITWDVTSCCQSSVINGWRFKGDYQSICQNNYQVVENWGKVYNHLQFNSAISNNGSPSSLVSGSTATFNYLLSGYNFSYPVAADAYWKIKFTLPPCATFNAGTIKFLAYDNTTSWMPTSVTQAGNVITAVFNGGAPFTLEQAQILIGLTANCNACPGGPGNVDVELFYSPSASCPCEILTTNNTFPLDVLCPITCVGLTFKDFSILRTSYGLPDNDNNGLADAVGSLNFSNIRTNRAMYGDTITSKYTGVIKTDVTHPTWQYCYVSSTITNGNYLSALGGTLKIYRANVLFATCNIPGGAYVNPVATFKYDLSGTALIASGGAAAGFLYLNNDSLVFEPKYRVSSNTGGTILPAVCTNEFYTSDIALPTNAVNKFSCNNFQGNFSIIGYYYTNYGPDSYTVNDCNNINITQNYYLSIGPCCSNYAGGNLFPFEVRQWAVIDTLEVIVPVGYKFVSANFADVRTAGTLAASGSPSFTLSPLSTAANVFKFPVGQFFTGANPLITPSDDGFYGVLNVQIQPSCQVVQNVQQAITYNWKFKPGSFLEQNPASNVSSTVGQDIILYNGPDIFLQSPLPNIIANTNVVTWDISLSNTSNSTSANTWFAAPTISGVTITQAVDLATSATLTPVGGIFQIGNIGAGNIKNYRLTATYTSCTLDSITVHAGWNCQGYPTNLASYPCTPKTIKLKLTPQSPLLITNVISPPTNINLCDTATYTVEGINIQLGSAYSLTLTVNLPLGVTIIPGSSLLSYPTASPYVSIGNPVYIGGTLYQYNVSVLSPSIAANGLPGILDPSLNSVKIKFKVITSCGYTSGSLASFSFQGKSACGLSTGQLVSLSSQLGINGATAPYFTDTRLKSTYISPCNSPSTLEIYVKNLGGLNFGNTDSVTVILPPGVSFVTGSFVGLHNAPANTIPTIFNINNQQELSWKMPQGTVTGDSIKFNINYVGDANALSCSIFNFISKTTSSTNLYCTVSGNNCGVKVYTGGDTLPIFTYKGYLTLTNQTGYSVPNPAAGETGYIGFTINNTGEAINPVNKTKISYYHDVNNNGVYNPGDILIGIDSINALIPNNGSYNYTYTLAIPAGSACNIIAVVDTAINPCACNPAQIPVILPLKHFARDTIICSGQPANIGYAGITGYTYTWTPGSNLNASNVANPVVTGTNSSGNPETTQYIVTVNRNNCLSKDTATVIVNLTPTSNAGPDQSLCNTYSVTLAAGTPLGILTGAWTQLSGPNAAIFSNTVSPGSTATSLSEGTYRFIWTVSNGNCTPAKDTVEIRIYNPPVAQAGPDQSLCATFSVALAANTPTGTSTGAWTQVSGPNAGAFTNTTSATSNVNGLAEGTYKFLWTMSNGNCASVNDTVIINVYNAPIAQAGPDQNLCATYSVVLAANTPTGTATGAWTQVSGPNAGAFTNTISATSNVNGLAEGTYKFLWTMSNGNCTPAKDTVIVNVYNTPVAQAGPDQNLCATYSVALAANTATGTATGAWTQAGGPVGSVFTNTTSATSNVSGLTEGTYKFLWTMSNGNCVSVNDTVLINVYNTPVAQAGPDQNLCATYTVALAANTPTGTSTGAWTQVSGPNAGAFTNTTSATSNVNGLAEGTYKFLWTMSNGNCTPVNDTMLVNVYNTPIAQAGPDQNLCATYSVALAANTPTGTSTGAWTQASGPNAGAFTNTISATSNVTGLTEGTYKFLWTMSNGSCASVNDTVIINVYNTPVAQAGPDQNLCATYSVALAANTPTGTSTGAWTQVSGPNAGAFTNTTSATSNVNGLAEGTYKFLWTMSNGNCASVNDTVLVNVYNTPIAQAGPDQNLCATYSVALAANTPTGTATGAWTQASGPVGSSFTNTTSATSNVSGLTEGTYKFLWTMSNGTCTPAKDTVIIKVYNTPIAQAGADQNLCATYSVALAANTPTGTSTGAWTKVSGPNGSAFTNTTSATSNVTGLAEGTYKFLWTMSNGNCTPVNDTVLVNVYNTPIAQAGPDQNLCATYSVALAANTPTGTSTGAWTQTSGPNAGAFSNTTTATPSVTGLTEGTYKFLWTMSNGSCTPAKDTVIINVYNTPIAQAGPDQNLCATYSVALAANTPTGTATGAWTQVSGPNAGAFTNTTSATSNVTGLAEGTYRFLWTMSNGSCAPVKDTVIIKVYNTPVAHAGPDQSLCATYSVALAANTPTGTATGAWTQVSGPNAGAFTNTTSATSNVNALAEGSYKFLWTMSNGNCASVNDTVIVKVYNTPIAQAGPDQSLCATYTVALAANTPTGTATGAWTQVSGPNAGTFTNASSATSGVTGLAEGTYKFLWTMSNGNCTSVNDTVIVKVYDTPVSAAGPDRVLCATTSTVLAANVPAGTSSGLWTAIGGGTFVTATQNNTAVNGLAGGNTYAFVWTVSNGNCPAVSDTVIIKDYNLPTVKFSSDKTAICEYSCISFKDLSIAYQPDTIIAWNWNFNNGTNSGLQNTKACYGTEGAYPTQLTITTRAGCSNTGNLPGGITVHPNAVADFRIDPTDADLATIVQFIDQSGHTDNWNWNFGDSQVDFNQHPTHLYQDTGMFVVTLIADNQYQCPDTLSVNIRVKEVPSLFIPNSFTPNGDGLNDVFLAVLNDHDLSDFELRVFDRWGQQLFSSNDPLVGWDGTFKGSVVKMEVYVYMVTARFKSGPDKRVRKYTGNVNVIR
jgi:gliding motility-associated-like protein